jgi:predicted CoA-substrate-specific enzyme activase
MEHLSYILGVDIGSVSTSIVKINPNMDILNTSYLFHHGNIELSLEKALKNIDLSEIGHVAVTTSTSSYINNDAQYDQLVAIIRACKHLHNNIGSILNVGGEKFNLSYFDETQKYSGSKHNTSCAAGTGSFLDQQAIRLGLESSQELSKKALSNFTQLPDIATRCAVFAKTDLIHAQQEGYSIPQICDGLCKGLAKNIFNTLFSGTNILLPVIFCGGVSKNLSVKKHLEKLLKNKLIIDEYSNLYGALGAALCLTDELSQPKHIENINTKYHISADFLKKEIREKKVFYPALSLSMSEYPDFEAHENFIYENVEIDIYIDPSDLNPMDCYIGIDVGSTSTKSIIMTNSHKVVAGFYTRTASKPVDAILSILKAQNYVIKKYNLDINIIGCGTTGSGRKLASKIIGADILPDEITAHAKAAVMLNPDVDTIIEIGGQDAKFTTLKHGNVTSSTMNAICAAGTGSFIEEQANKLGCPILDYSKRTESVKSPLSSDRCTVFMERDMNHFLTLGYNTNQVLASALHSVRDNYLSKVASEGEIGNTILFQGATAKNKALVAAFEQKLKKPIHVSKYCHLTGALGICLLLSEQTIKSHSFKGFELYKTKIPVSQETCQLCTNHCKITIAEVNNQIEAFGFLCGRDYNTNTYIPKAQDFNLLKQRKKVLERIDLKTNKHSFTIGLPAALHMVEDLNFWKNFFNNMGIKTITSENLQDPVKLGKNIAGAEFCTPILSLHGHIAHLMEKADFIFLPYYFEEPKEEKTKRRQHCYYTQFIPSIISNLPGIDEKRLISPLIKYLYTNFYTKIELYKSLKNITSEEISFFKISSAWDRSSELKTKNQTHLKQIYSDNKNNSSSLNVVLVGRPYTILSKSLNSRIPDIFANFDVKAFYQDMLDCDNYDFSDIDGLLEEIHWHHAAEILKATYIAANTDNLYPVYISSFNCSPDSFCKDYFKQIMEAYKKPYLILELDEHDSSVGYETRIEAAIGAFSNHKKYSSDKQIIDYKNINPELSPDLKNKDIFFPNWDDITGKFLVSILKSEGYNAYLMEETEETLKQCLRTNTGQCIPLNAVASSFIHTVNKFNLDPSNSLVWVGNSEIACNVKLYSHHIKQILKKEKNGFEHSMVYSGEVSLVNISMKAGVNAYFAYMFGGLLRKVGCQIRPYEIHKGETNAAIKNATSIIAKAFRNKTSKDQALEESLAPFLKIQMKKEKRPKVSIFGDLYMRDNNIINQDLINYIEKNGGEVVTTPYSRFIRMIASTYFKKWFNEGKYLHLVSNKTLLFASTQMEKKFYKYFAPLLNENELDYSDSPEKILEEYGMRIEHTGESMDNILKIHYVLKEHPDIALFVQVSPSFCCPSMVTEAMAGKIEKNTGVPVVSITYDLSGGNKNNVIIPFLKFSKKEAVQKNLLEDCL